MIPQLQYAIILVHYMHGHCSVSLHFISTIHGSTCFYHISKTPFQQQQDYYSQTSICPGKVQRAWYLAFILNYCTEDKEIPPMTYTPLSLFSRKDLPLPHLAYRPTVIGNDNDGSLRISAKALLYKSYPNMFSLSSFVFNRPRNKHIILNIVRFEN